MKNEQIPENLYGILKILEIFCEYTNSEDTTVMKPLIMYARSLADDLWYEQINKGKKEW